MKIKKVLIIGICIMAILIAVAGETWLIIKHEKEYQMAEAGVIYDNIALNLDMIKISIQTGDEEMLNENLNSAKNQLKNFDRLFIAKKQDKEHINEIDLYLNFINEKRSLVGEISLIKTKILDIKNVLQETYSGGKVTKDEINTVSEKVISLKINNEEFRFEVIKVVVMTTNSMLDDFAVKADELGRCLGVCYKNKISELTNGLSEIVKAYSEKVDELNRNIEKEFELEKIDRIK